MPLQIMSGDPQTDPTVKKTLNSVLKGFHNQYQEDRSMKVYAQWWDEVGGARGVRVALPVYFYWPKAETASIGHRRRTFGPK